MDKIHRPTPRILLAMGMALLLPAAVAGQDPAPPQCSTEEYRLFDFWEGSWSVTPLNSGDNTNPPARNEITRKLNGCVIHEEYSTAGGFAGESFSIFDGRRGVWHQTWVDNSGFLLQAEGNFVDGRMVLEGPGVDAGGQGVNHRISWGRIDGNPDRVRQLWESSSDEGETWTVVFDGLYTRVGTD